LAVQSGNHGEHPGDKLTPRRGLTAKTEATPNDRRTQGLLRRIIRRFNVGMRDKRPEVSQPKIILADEPTAALDKKSGRDVVEIMEKLAKEQGCTILLVTHDNRILDLADRIVYMKDGYLVNRSEVGAIVQ
jgi:ABC-type multidrug transport system ATPase subunit